MFSGHSGIKLEINTEQNSCKLNNRLLNNKRDKEEIKTKIR